MISHVKKLSFLVFILAAGMGVILFQIKQKVIFLEKDLVLVNKRIVEVKEETHILEADWGYLNSPERIRELSKAHLKLRPVDVIQLASLESLQNEEQSWKLVRKKRKG